MTYSIVGADLDAGEVGCAVQSKYFAVGAVVPWARAGVGAVATQAAGVAAYGGRVLEQIEAGKEPAEALRLLLADDEARETRQLGVVTADGRAASFTGSECNDWAGDVQGAGFAAQGNILAGPEVVAELERAFEKTDGPLAERLMASLEAAEAAGGDRRGRQSAAIIVERAGNAAGSPEGIDRVVDLRVDDHPEPIEELRRLLGIHTGWRVASEAMAFYERKDFAGGIELMRRGLARASEPSGVLLYQLACFESLSGQPEAAVAHLSAAIEADPSWRADARADSDFDPIRDDVSLRELLR
ncbi:MAG: hypothetical protein QOF50_930 [Gaiellaceae bacterium]|nr:hypothetical protein [Gaiellaceae bacterium]